MTEAPPAGVSVTHLEAVAELRHRDPRRALREARSLLSQPGCDDEVRAVGAWVVGLCLHELARFPAAIKSYRTAIDSADTGGFAGTSSLARASLAVSLVSIGDTDDARRQSQAADTAAPDAVAPVVRLLHGLVLQRTGELNDALGLYASALDRLRARGQQGWIARLLVNRGVLLAYRGDVDEAVDDLGEAEAIARRLDLVVLVAMAAHNLGFAESRRGRPIEALRAFDRASAAYDVLGRPRRLVAVLDGDRCEVLLSVGLTSEARTAAAAAVDALARAGASADLAEARLLHAQACLADGHDALAADEARRSAVMLHDAGREAWAALAEHVELQAVVQSSSRRGRPPAGLLARARAITRALDANGWPVEAMQARTFVGRIALAHGQRETARTELAMATRTPRGPARLRVQTWHAAALLRLADGDVDGAMRALESGMDVVDTYRRALGATELRTRASRLGSDLARLGTRLALRQRRPELVLVWSDRWRASALRAAPVRPPDDASEAADLARLRRLVGEEQAAMATGQDTKAVQDEIERVERAIRERTLRRRADAEGRGARSGRDDDGGPRASGRRRPGPTSSLDVERLRGRLGGRTLVELLEVGGVLHAVLVDATRLETRRLGPLAPIEDEMRHLLFALRRLSTAPAGSPRVARAGEALAAAAGQLERALLRPLRLPSRPDLVLVPTGRLHALPWAALPGIRRGTLELSPSASMWLRPSGRGGPRVTLVAGPGLPGAQLEVAELATIHRRARVMTGDAATTAAVLDAFASTDLLHLAAHGEFRADAPFFSRLALADGPLTVYDLERVRCRVSTVILPACDAAVSDVLAGDEVIGTAAALLGRGVRSVVAPILPIPDVASVPLMLDVHRGLRGGDLPAVALASAVRAAEESDDPQRVAAASAFLCIGSDRAGVTATGSRGGAVPDPVGLA